MAIKKNRVVLDKDLRIIDREDRKFSQFTSDANTIEVLAPVSEEMVFYGNAQPTGRSTFKKNDRHRGEFIGTATHNGESLNVWRFKPFYRVFSSPNADGIKFQAEWRTISDDRFIGAEYIDAEAVSSIHDELVNLYPDAKDGQIVRVISEDADYKKKKGIWEEIEKVKLAFYVVNSDIVSFSLDKSNDASEPTHEPTATELIFSALNKRLTKTEGDERYYNKNKADGKFAPKEQTQQDIQDLKDKRLSRFETEAMHTDLDMGGYNILGVDDINGNDFNNMAQNVDDLLEFKNEKDPRISQNEEHIEDLKSFRDEYKTRVQKNEDDIDAIKSYLDLDGDV